MNSQATDSIMTAEAPPGRDWALCIRQPQVRVPLLVLLHIVLFTLIYAFSFAARYDFALPEVAIWLLQVTLPPVVITKVAVFYFGRHFHGWWRYVTFADLSSLLRVSLLSMVTIAFVDYYLLLFNEQIPRLTILIDTLLTIIVVGGLRCSWRFVDEQLGPVLQRRAFRPAIMVGTDHAVGQLIGQINSNQSIDLRLKALVSTDTDNWYRSVIGGVPVAGPIHQIASVAEKYRAKDVLVPAGLLSGRQLRTLVQECNANKLQLRVLPRLADTLQGSSKIPLRPLDIDDLLKREPVKLDTERLAKLIKNKRVLITGAGGSIGSEICRQLMDYAPSELILLGRGENRIHAIHLELRDRATEAEIQLTQVIGSITDEDAMRKVFAKRQPEIVFHAAAHKHVPLMELHVGEAVKNNVYGTKVIASLANEFGVGHFVLVSSDKAVNPTSVMGCTKHLAERVVHEYSQSSNTRFVVVRFGNVLGSAGSVIPVFQKQIERGGPITITDKEMTRFFMSIPEAAQLVMQSAAMSKGGEIFVLDMGQPIPIVQLAEDLVSLSGLPPGSIEFEFVGIRPGEKLHEELYFDDESTAPTDHHKVRAAYARECTDGPILPQVDALIANADSDPIMLRQRLAMLVPSYQSSVNLPLVRRPA
ncbi:MAG: UDP-N-acetylglucosamine 4,6-dehydratase family protein [Planctomycetaceae bacterium]